MSKQGIGGGRAPLATGFLTGHGRQAVVTGFTWALWVIAPALSICLLGVFGFRAFSGAVRANTETMQRAMAAAMVDMVEHELQRGVNFARSVASLPDVVQDARWRDARGMRVRLQEVVEAYDGLARGFVTDVNGMLWSDYPSAPESLGKRLADRDWYRGVSRARRVFVTVAERWPTEPESPVLSVAAPIHGDGEQWLGILVLQYRVTDLVAWMKRLSLGSGDRALLLDHTGAVAAYSQPNPEARGVGGYAASVEVRRALRGELVAGHYADPLDGRAMVGAFAPVMVGQHGWVLAVEQPREAAHAPVRALAWQLSGAFGSLLLGLMAALALLVSAGERNRRLAEQVAGHDRLLRELADLVQQSSDAMIGQTADGRIATWNHGAEQLFGYAGEDILGKPFTILMAPNRAQEVPRLLERVQGGQECAPCDMVGVRKDGREVKLSLTLLPIRGPDRSLAGTSVIAREVTELKGSEQRQQEQAQAPEGGRAELARRERIMHSLVEDIQAAKERIEEQAKSLRAANEKLSAMTALKDEFVAKVSHELRTPLTSIKEGLSLLLDNALGQTTPDQQDFLRTMDGDIDRLTELISNMLDISKIEAGRMRLARRRLDLRRLIESLVRSYEPLLSGRTVRVEYGEAPPVFADNNRLLQVLTNLLSNALKFTPQEGAITLRMAPHDGMASIAVQDAGPGVPPEDLPRLFQKFSQVGPQGEGRPRGTGLGLVICKELIELHGGRIEVVSEIGRGSTFTIFLPAYSDRFALGEGFREQLLELKSSAHGHAVALLLLQAAGLLTEGSGSAPSELLQRLAEDVRRLVHRGDTVLAIEPSWIAILAVTSPTGVQAMAGRLRQALRDGERLRAGAALYPADGDDAATLLERASSRIEPLPAAAGGPAGSIGSTG